MFELFNTDVKKSSTAEFLMNPKAYRAHALEETNLFREYIAQEAQLQYRDYYESEPEERGFFEFMDTGMTNRDKIRFMELYEDVTAQREDIKDFVMIRKREHNPSLSVFSNLVLDLVDFKDRVRPLAKDISLMDVARDYQKQSVQERESYRDDLKEALEGFDDEYVKQLDAVEYDDAGSLTPLELLSPSEEEERL